MTYGDLGYNDSLERYKIDQNLESFEVGRVISEHRERYVVRIPDQEFDAELIGNLRYTATSRYDFPAVGDWVAFSRYDLGKALIHAIYPRSSILERQASGQAGQVQVIAVNIDTAMIVQAVDRDFNLNRIERYLTICNASKIEALIVLSKIDLIGEAELKSLSDQIRRRIKDVEILTAGMQAEGYLQLEAVIKKGKTYCLLGSSGVGKSTLLNVLSGKEKMKTGEISKSVNKGKHITSHRELFVLDRGGILIDNPGMREVGIADTAGGLELTFESILKFAENCRFKDCTHQHEEGCAILAAVDRGDIDVKSYANFQKMEREKAHFELDILERKKKDRDFGKMIKHVKKQRKDNNF